MHENIEFETGCSTSHLALRTSHLALRTSHLPPRTGSEQDWDYLYALILLRPMLGARVETLSTKLSPGKALKAQAFVLADASAEETARQS